MKKNYRFNEKEQRDKEVLEFLESARNETELVKNALVFYKKAIEKRVVFDTNINSDDMWDNVFESAVALKFIEEDRDKVKKKLLKQLKKEHKEETNVAELSDSLDCIDTEYNDEEM